MLREEDSAGLRVVAFISGEKVLSTVTETSSSVILKNSLQMVPVRDQLGFAPYMPMLESITVGRDKVLFIEPVTDTNIVDLYDAQFSKVVRPDFSSPIIRH